MTKGHPALLTDHYELTMVSAALKDGTADRQSVFEVFARRLPPGRRYGVVAGTGRLIDLVREFRFTAEDLDYLRERSVVDAETAEWLANFRFHLGDLHGHDSRLALARPHGEIAGHPFARESHAVDHAEETIALDGVE